MRIGFDAKRAFNNFTGLGNYSRFVIDALREYCPENDYFLFTPSARQHPETGHLLERFSVIQAPILYKRTGLKSLWRSFGMSNDITRAGIDIYHGLSNELPFGGGRYKRVVTIHDLIFIRYPELYNSIDRRIYWRKFKTACRKADRIVAISQQTKADIVEFFQEPDDKIDVVYQGVHPNFLRSWSTQELDAVRKKYNLPDQFILNVGTVEKRKNALLILKALKVGKLDVPVVIVGRHTAYVSELREYIEKNKLEKQVVFLQNVSFPDLPALYELCDVFVYPSFFEGFGIPVLEALYRNRSVITSKGSCFHEAGGEVALYTDPDDENELAALIGQLLNKEVTREKQCLIRDHLKKFHPKAIASDYQTIYKKL